MNIKLCVFKKIIAIFGASLIVTNIFTSVNAMNGKKTADKSATGKNDANPVEESVNPTANNVILNHELINNNDYSRNPNIILNNDEISTPQMSINDQNGLFKKPFAPKCFLGQKRKNDSLGTDFAFDGLPLTKNKVDFGGMDGGDKTSNSKNLINVDLQKNKNDIKNMLKIFGDVSQLRSAINSYLHSKEGSDAWKKNLALVNECLKKLFLAYQNTTIFDSTRQIEAAHMIFLELKKINKDENLINGLNYYPIFSAVRFDLRQHISKKFEHIFRPVVVENESYEYSNEIIDRIFKNSERVNNIFDYAYDDHKISNMLNCSIASHFEDLFYKKLQSVKNKRDAINREMEYICGLILQIKLELGEKSLFEGMSNNKELEEKLMSILKKNVVYLTEMITGCNSQKMVSCKSTTRYGVRYYIYSFGSFNEDLQRYRSGKRELKLELFKLLKKADINASAASFNLDECIIFDPLVDDYESKRDLRGCKFFALPPQKIDKFNKTSEPDLGEKKKILSLIHKSLEKIYFPLSDENNNMLSNSTRLQESLDEILTQINNMKKLYR